MADEINRTSPKTQASLLEAMAEGQVTVDEIKVTVSKITVNEPLLGYMEDIVTMTRQEGRSTLGASPRAMLALMWTFQAKAFLQGRDYVKLDDVKAVAVQVLLHRLGLSSEARMQQSGGEGILRSLINKVNVPVD